jgi:hypothetical protein
VIFFCVGNDDSTFQLGCYDRFVCRPHHFRNLLGQKPLQDRPPYEVVSFPDACRFRLEQAYLVSVDANWKTGTAHVLSVKLQDKVGAMHCFLFETELYFIPASFSKTQPMMNYIHPPFNTAFSSCIGVCCKRKSHVFFLPNRHTGVNSRCAWP